MSVWRRFSACRFQRQLNALSSLGLLGLALAITLTSSLFLMARLESLALVLLGEVTVQLANESRLVFFESAASALERANQMAAFPGVGQAALFKPDARLWAASSAASRWPALPLDPAAETRVALMFENRDYWYIAAPVRTGAVDLSPMASRAEAQLLGHVALAWRKGPLSDLRAWLFALNGGIALMLAAAIIVAFQRLSRRLTLPLVELAGVMRRLQTGDGSARAAIAGPEETREIGRAFNALLERLEQHRAVLESEVSMRTHDLIAARDLALTADRYKTAFLATMSHEMRTPLQSIIGYTRESENQLKFMEEDADPVILDTLAGNFGIVLKSAKELMLQINQVLEITALEAGKRDVSPKWIDLSDLVAEVVSALRLNAEQSGNRMEVTCTGSERVEIDDDKLRQILRNLLDNACKFTQDGKVSLAVRADAGGVTVDVTDTGIGIPADKLDLIFEPFRQVDMSDARRYGGTGLGLAITKSLCQLLGGTITVASTPGAGSCFHVEIPPPSPITWGAASESDGPALSVPHAHRQAQARAQNQGGFWSHPRAGCQRQVKTIDDPRHDGRHLHLGEMLSQTDPRAAAKGKVDVAGPVGRLARCEAVGVEAFWGVPVFRMPVRDIRAHYD